MNELTIAPGDEASFSMGTLMGDMEREGAHLPGTLRERCRKFWRRASLASGARWGTCGVVDIIFGGLQMGIISLCGCSVRGAPFWGFGRMREEGSGDGHHFMGVH